MKSIDEIIEKYKKVPEPTYETRSHGPIDYQICRPTLPIHSGFPNTQNPDLMDKETYKQKKDELIKSSRLYEASKETTIETNDWDGE